MTIGLVDEEQRLIDLSQRGDADAFNQLVRWYEARVYNLCFRMVGDTDSAADAAQDTFIAVFRHIRQFRGGVFRAWVMRIATNICHDMLRARKRRPLISLDHATRDDEGDEQLPEIASSDESPDETAERRQVAATVQRALAQLPEDQRIVVVLSDIQGYSYEEIAAVIDANLGTVKSRLSRGRARMRELLKAAELLPSVARHENSNSLSVQATTGDETQTS